LQHARPALVSLLLACPTSLLERATPCLILRMIILTHLNYQVPGSLPTTPQGAND
jgi:hypothetical protein